LGRLGAARLSDYTASKAALIAFHTSLTAELAEYPFLKTILAVPGHLSTEMFDSLKQDAIAQFFGPVVEPQDLALKLIRMVNAGSGGVLSEPLSARWMSVLDLLPVGIAAVIRRLAGVDSAMATFVKKKDEKT